MIGVEAIANDGFVLLGDRKRATAQIGKRQPRCFVMLTHRYMACRRDTEHLPNPKPRQTVTGPGKWQQRWQWFEPVSVAEPEQPRVAFSDGDGLVFLRIRGVTLLIMDRIGCGWPQISTACMHISTYYLFRLTLFVDWFVTEFGFLQKRADQMRRGTCESKSIGPLAYIRSGIRNYLSFGN